MNFGRLGSRQISLLRVKKIGLWGVMLLVVAGGFWKEWESTTRASVDRREIPNRTRDEQREIKIEKKSLKRQSTPVLKTRNPQIEEPLTDQRSANHSPLSSQLRQGPWTLPLQRLVEVGRSGEEVTDALTDLLECQSGMGDTLLQLLLEGGGTRDEKRALLVALGTALVLSPSPEGLWVDRRSCLEWAIELWIDGYEDLSSLDRWLWQVEGIDGDLAFSWIDQFLTDPLLYPEGSSKRERWRKVVIEGLQSEAKVESPAWLDQWALEWLDSEDPEFRQIVLGVLGKIYSQADPQLRFQLQSKIERMEPPWRLEAGKELLRHVDGDQLGSVIDDWADFFIRHEFRGEELLIAFHQARNIRLDSILQRQGVESDSEAYRMWVLSGALGGLDSDGEFPLDWFQTLEKTARLDSAQGVRFLALRLCAMGWNQRSRSVFEDLVRSADVSVVQGNHAIGLLPGNP